MADRKSIYPSMAKKDERKGEEKAVEKKAETKGKESEGASIHDKHREARSAMHKRHEQEARDLHSGHRDAMRDMHSRHEKEEAEMNTQQDTEATGGDMGATAGPGPESPTPEAGGGAEPTE